MGLRTINLEQSETDCLTQLGENKPIWNSMRCRLVTPMYGGGVQAAIPDIKMPIRAAAIRGQLRFWWRLLAKQKWNLQGKALHQAESALWGGMETNDTKEQASKVFLRVKEIGSIKKIPYFQKFSQQKRERKKNAELSPYSYVLFAMDNTDEEEKTELIQEGLIWTLEWRFADTDKARISETEKKQVLETLRWWAMFGGVGARTRRGCGAFIVETCSIQEIMQPISVEEAQEAGCRLVMRQETGSAKNAWKEAVMRLRDFRQGEGVGRNKGRDTHKPGRSRWIEADELRHLAEEHDANHPPLTAKMGTFPRGLFGMPIITTFKDLEDPGKNIQLLPNRKERMASPLIIRPVINSQRNWVAAALLLPYEHLMDLEATVEGGRLKGKHMVKLWSENAVLLSIKPIQQNDGKNPLDAFLNYFTKK